MTYRLKVIRIAFLTLWAIALPVSSTNAVTLGYDDGGKTEESQLVQAVPLGTTHVETTHVGATPGIGGQPAAQIEVIDGELDAVDWKSLVGKTVTIKGSLVIIDTHDLVRRGQVKVARNRLYVPTSKIDPNDKEPSENSFEGGNNIAQVVAAQKSNDKGTIIMFPELGKSLATVRIGSTIKDVSGKLVKAGSALLLVPSQPLKWTPAERPERPDVGKADVSVASFNVLNYFTTIDNGENKARGADSKPEFERQEGKIVAAIIGFRDAPGGADAIRVGIIYRTDRVKPVGEVSMIREDAFFRARTPVVQQFKSKKSGKPFTVIVNHFKSKGGASGADAVDKNKGDGQGAYNATRRDQALAVCNYIDKLGQTNSNLRALVIGDLNAYEQEDPIDAMRAKGLVNLQERLASSSSSDAVGEDYSYVYRGQSGTLDHAMATEALAKDVTGIATWHINSDEPRSMDYNMEYNPKSLYQADPFRSSDHDPVLIGIQN